MQTIYYSTPNYIRHTGNVVDLGEYRRKLEQASQPEFEFSDLPCRPMRRDAELERPAGRPASRAARRALPLPDLGISLSVVVMALSFTLRVLVL